MKKIGQEQLLTILRTVCAKDTSSDPALWGEHNPLWGHCAVVALIVQDRFGGELRRTSLENTGIRALENSAIPMLRSHYWNRLPDGKDVDFTREQFGLFRTSIPMWSSELRTREYLLSNQDTKRRYELLKARLEKALETA